MTTQHASSNPLAFSSFLEEEATVARFVEAVNDLDADGAKDALHFSFLGSAWGGKSLIMEILQTWLSLEDIRQPSKNENTDKNCENLKDTNTQQKIDFVEELLPHCFKHDYNPLLDCGLEEVFGFGDGDILYPVLAKFSMLYDCTDKNGNTIYHFASQHIIPSSDCFVGAENTLNRPNHFGETVMHCFFDDTYGIYTGMPDWAESLKRTLLSVEKMGGQWDIPDHQGLTALDRFKQGVAKLNPHLRSEIEPFLWEVATRIDKKVIGREVEKSLGKKKSSLGKKM